MVAGLLALLVGCGSQPNTGDVQIDEVRADAELGRCMDAAFPMEPTFFAERKRIDSIGIFLQTTADLGQNSDLVYIEVFQPDRFRRRSGEWISFGYPTRTASPARAEVDLFDTCPDLNTSLAVQGRLRFERLETEAGGRVVGDLEGTVVDTRTGRTVARGLAASWNFEVEVTAPHRSFPTYDDDDYPNRVDDNR